MKQDTLEGKAKTKNHGGHSAHRGILGGNTAGAEGALHQSPADTASEPERSIKMGGPSWGMGLLFLCWTRKMAQFPKNDGFLPEDSV